MGTPQCMNVIRQCCFDNDNDNLSNPRPQKLVRILLQCNNPVKLKYATCYALHPHLFAVKTIDRFLKHIVPKVLNIMICK